MSARVSAAEVCAGYSGLLLAMRAAGWPVDLSWVSETDDDAKIVLDRRHSGVPNLGDMTAVRWEGVASVDVCAGGIPCQPWSGAGDRRGSDDERDLWPVRKTDDGSAPRRGAVDMLRVLRPPVFLLENVANLVTAEGGRPFGTILSDLHELGYNAGWVTVGACRVGACHHRHRVFLIATLGEVLPPEGLLFGVPLSAATKWPTSGLMVGGHIWPIDMEVCGAPDMLLLPTPTARDATRGAGRKEPEGRPLSEVVALIPDGGFGLYSAAVRRQERQTGVPAPRISEPGRLGRPRLTAAFTQWMQMLPDGWLTDVLDRKAAIERAGNGVNPSQGALAIRLLSAYMPSLMPTSDRLGVAA